MRTVDIELGTTFGPFASKRLNFLIRMADGEVLERMPGRMVVQVEDGAVYALVESLTGAGGVRKVSTRPLTVS